MKPTSVFLWLSVLLLAQLHTRAAEIGTAFTYQGSLEDGSGPVTDTCDFRFGLWDAAAGGNPRGGSPQTKAGVVVTGGIFTVPDLDFGPQAINGTAAWLEIEVQCPGDAGFTLLLPRVAITPAPHALALPGLYTQQNATSPNLIGGHSGNLVIPGVYGATIAGGGQGGLNNNNRVIDYFGTVGGGLGNLAGNDEFPGFLGLAPYATVGGGWGNAAVFKCATVGGGCFNGAGDYSTVSGGDRNGAGGHYSTVGGGGENGITGDYSTVPGGRSNTVDANYSLAAGSGAHVYWGHNQTFVWSDGSPFPFGSTGPNQFLINASGGVGIGTNSPSAQLHVVSSTANFGNNTAMFHAPAIGGSASHIHYGTTGDWYIRSASTSGKVVLQDDGGRVGIGREPITNKLEVEGNASKTTSGSWLANSDAAIKTQVRTVSDALSMIARLRPVAFRYTEDYKAKHPTVKDQDYYNYIAQEFRDVFPDWVQDSGEDGLLQMDSYPASVYSVAAIQELHAIVTEKYCEIEMLDSEISNLKSEISDFKSENARLKEMEARLARLEALLQGHSTTEERP